MKTVGQASETISRLKTKSGGIIDPAEEGKPSRQERGNRSLVTIHVILNQGGATNSRGGVRESQYKKIKA